MKTYKTKGWLNENGKDIDIVFKDLNSKILNYHAFAQRMKVPVCFPGFGNLGDLEALKQWGFDKYAGYAILETWVYDLVNVLKNYGCKHQSLRWFQGYVTGKIYNKSTTTVAIHNAEEDVILGESNYIYGVNKGIFLSPFQFYGQKPHINQLPEDFIAFVRNTCQFTDKVKETYRNIQEDPIGDFQSDGLSSVFETIVDVPSDDDDCESDVEDNFPDDASDHP